jgi:hypothetical protein
MKRNSRLLLPTAEKEQANRFLKMGLQIQGFYYATPNHLLWKPKIDMSFKRPINEDANITRYIT